MKPSPPVPSPRSRAVTLPPWNWIKPAGERQPQPQSAAAAFEAVVGLSERLEDPVDRFWRHADAAVADDNRRLRLAAACNRMAT